jgi:hypothetical protein
MKLVHAGMRAEFVRCQSKKEGEVAQLRRRDREFERETTAFDLCCALEASHPLVDIFIHFSEGRWRFGFLPWIVFQRGLASES